MKVLIAEDVLLNQSLMRMYMNKLGWDCVIVDNGLLAVEACKTGTYDVILMDINMPELNGIKATKLIKAFNNEIPIIAITAYPDEDLRKECAEIGMNAFVEQPFSHKELKNIIAGLVSYTGLETA
jgi:CheY-like chemotaxis protein